MAGEDNSPDDLTLMRAIKAGDRAALSTFYDRHSPIVLAICCKILHDASEAEDVLTDVFFEVWSRSERFDSTRGNPLTYLLTLARSRAIDRKRAKDARLPLRSDDAGLDTRTAQEPTPYQSSNSSEQCEIVRKTLANLAPEQRQALECAYYEGLSHSEIAEKLNKPLGTVKTYIRQGLIQLRQDLRIT